MAVDILLRIGDNSHALVGDQNIGHVFLKPMIDKNHPILRTCAQGPIDGAMRKIVEA